MAYAALAGRAVGVPAAWRVTAVSSSTAIAVRKAISATLGQIEAETQASHVCSATASAQVVFVLARIQFVRDIAATNCRLN